MLFSLDLLKLTHPASSNYKDDNDTAVMALRTSTKLFHIGDVSTESEDHCVVGVVTTAGEAARSVIIK